MANFVSAATIVPGALLAYCLSADFDVTFEDAGTILQSP